MESSAWTLQQLYGASSTGKTNIVFANCKEDLAIFDLFVVHFCILLLHVSEKKDSPDINVFPAVNVMTNALTEPRHSGLAFRPASSRCLRLPLPGCQE